MDFLLDDPQIEETFREILGKIRLRKNGETVAQMKKLGLNYKINWGVSIIHLRELAKDYKRDHLLALKLWNKGWRETMILATMLEEPDQLSEQQMDFWTKTTETAEVIEQAVINLFVHSKYAFVKAMEYCCGKKHLVRLAGLLLVGRLAMVDKKAINEMFEEIFPMLTPLAKDPALTQTFYRSFTLLANRNKELCQSCEKYLEELQQLEEENARNLAAVLLEDIREMEW